MDLNKFVAHSDFHMNVASEAAASRSNSPTTRRSPRGLSLRNGIWHIDKVLFGRRLCESTHTSDLKEAEMLLAHRVSQARRVHLYGEPAEHTFRAAGVKFQGESAQEDH
jgi:hypothetical protein